MTNIKSQLTKIKENYNNEYSIRFDRNGLSNTLKNNVLLVAELQLKLAEELVDETKKYYFQNNISEIKELEEFRNNLYMEFIFFATKYQG